MITSVFNILVFVQSGDIRDKHSPNNPEEKRKKVANKAKQMAQKIFELHPLSYHKKSVRSALDETDGGEIPLQIMFPAGLMGIAMPISRAGGLNGGDGRGNNASQNGNDNNNEAGARRNFEFVAVAAPPESEIADKLKRARLTIVFEVLIFVNLVITGLLFSNADVTDLTKVEKDAGSLPKDFTVVSDTRRGVENSLFAFTILTLLLGGAGAAFGSPFCLWLFNMITIMNAVLGVSAFPNFSYSLRYILDALLVNMGMKLQNMVEITVLPIPNSNHAPDIVGHMVE